MRRLLLHLTVVLAVAVAGSGTSTRPLFDVFERPLWNHSLPSAALGVDHDARFVYVTTTATALFLDVRTGAVAGSGDFEGMGCSIWTSMRRMDANPAHVGAALVGDGNMVYGIANASLAPLWHTGHFTCPYLIPGVSRSGRFVGVDNFTTHATFETGTGKLLWTDHYTTYEQHQDVQAGFMYIDFRNASEGFYVLSTINVNQTGPRITLRQGASGAVLWSFMSVPGFLRFDPASRRVVQISGENDCHVTVRSGYLSAAEFSTALWETHVSNPQLYQPSCGVFFDDVRGGVAAVALESWYSPTVAVTLLDLKSLRVLWNFTANTTGGSPAKQLQVGFSDSAVYLAYSLADSENVTATPVTVVKLDRATGEELGQRVLGVVLYGWFDIKVVEHVGLLFRGTVWNAQWPSQWLAMVPL